MSKIRTAASLIGAALFALAIGCCESAVASPGCTAFGSGEDISPGPSTNAGTGTGFSAGDVLTLTVVSNTGNLKDFGLQVGPATAGGVGSLNVIPSFTTVGSRTYTVPATTAEQLSVFVDAFVGGPGFTVTWSCTPGNGNAASNALHAMQASTMPMVAQMWGQNLAGVTTGAIGVGFSGNPLPFTPSPNGFTYYFTADPEAERNLNEAESVDRFLASPDGSNRPAANDFSALGYAGPLKAPPSSATPRDWLAWVDMRGVNLNNNTAGGDLHGNQVDVIAGVTRRLSSNLVIGALAGYETFNYNSLALAGALKGSGWTTGGYFGWYFAPQLRFEGTVAGSYLGVDDAAGGATGSFTGYRLITSGTVVGTYDWRTLKLEPSAQIYGVWERDNSFTDSTGTQQPNVNFSTGRAAGGIKASYPIPWMSNFTVAPYLGVYGDYYFSETSTTVVGLTPVPLLQGWGVRGSGGVAVNLFNRAQLSAGGEYEWTANNFQIWTWKVAGRIPF